LVCPVSDLCLLSKRWNGASTLACSLALALAGGGAARAQRLTATEASVGATAVLARRSFWGAELALARRPGGQGRLALAAAGGAYGGNPAMRLDASAQFLLKPGERAGTSLYGGLGIAFVGARSERGSGYLLALLGLESAPGRPIGWFAELGLAGGVRVAVGRRWRRFPTWWK